MAAWLAQNLSAIFQGAILTVFGFFAQRALRRIFATTRRTEAHVAETAEKLSNLDRVSLTGKNAALEEWQRDMALRIEAVADGRSDSLAWQAQFDRRLAAVEKFAQELDDFAHGHRDVPTYTRPTVITADLQEEPA